MVSFYTTHDRGIIIGMKIFWLWLSSAAVVTMMCGLAYLLVQQDIRQSANYPQSQIAEDVSSSVVSATTSATMSATAGLNAGLVDISTSLAPFLTTFDVNGNVVQSNAVLNGSTPVPPHGVFGYAQANGEDRFTWQPQVGVRIAAVLVYHAGNGGGTGAGRNSVGNNGATSGGGGFFALSGRSLRDVEILENRLMDDTFIVWLVALVVMFVLSIFTTHAFSVSGRKIKDDKGSDEKSSPQQNIVVPPRIIPPSPITPPITVPSQFLPKDNVPTNINTNTNINKIS